jgi:hypothetical protein
MGDDEKTEFFQWYGVGWDDPSVRAVAAAFEEGDGLDEEEEWYLTPRYYGGKAIGALLEAGWVLFPPGERPSHTAHVYSGVTVLPELLDRLVRCGYRPEVAPEDEWDTHFGRRTVLVHGAPVDGWPDLSLRRVEDGGFEFIWNGNIRVPIPEHVGG